MMEQAATDINVAALLVATAAVLVAILGSSLMTLGILLRQINRLDDKIGGQINRLDGKIDGLDEKFTDKIDGLDEKFTGKIDEASREQREATDKLRDMVVANGQRLARMEGMLAAAMPEVGPDPFPTQAHDPTAREQPSATRAQGPQAAAG